ncbi:MAG TPA: 50S ribosomal protein L6, partial [Candidatus Babeliales bacterium]|nr:50S ribosomal protein L6 [Candidatus Babeliales bacterium]
YYAIANTALSIIRNLCEGVVEGYTVKMKIVYAHFPITVKVKDENILVENFQGERAPRISKIRGDTKVVTKGDDVILTGSVLTDVAQTAASLQQNTKVKNKDHRVFLDGIYLFEKSPGIQK